MKFVIRFNEEESKKFLEYHKRGLTEKEIKTLEECHELYLRTSSKNKLQPGWIPEED